MVGPHTLVADSLARLVSRNTCGGEEVGALDGTATILVRRSDGLCWAVLFHARENRRGEDLAGLIDGLVHDAADRVKHWPTRDLFKNGM
jgi:hypothetical protein